LGWRSFAIEKELTMKGFYVVLATVASALGIFAQATQFKKSCEPLSFNQCLADVFAWTRPKPPDSGGPASDAKRRVEAKHSGDGRAEPGAIQRLASLVESDFVRDNITYGDLVDWYDQGMVGRDAVLKDRARYQARWPERSYKLVPGSIRITSIGPNRYVATFEQTYVVRSAPRNTQSSGKSAMTLEIEMVRGQPHIVKQRETTGRP
jgi:hypothetical protein